MEKIHINCDLGEGGKYDQELMPLISACNIACGGHAGTLETMQQSVDLAREHEVEIGAHPSYPDKENFGRTSVSMSPVELKRSLVAQILSLKQIAEAEGSGLKHVKPHGALYHDVQRDPALAALLIEAVEEFDDSLALYVPENTLIADLAAERLEIVYESFADRRYQADGNLVPRSEPGALLTDPAETLQQVISIFFQKASTGKDAEKICRTFCVHSDTPNAVDILRYFHENSSRKNIQVINAHV